MKHSVLFFSALFLFSCGLPTIPYLTPITSNDTSIIEFDHPPANRNFDGFQGYDIYYKLLTSSQTGQDEIDGIIDGINDYENPDVSPLTSRGFRKVAVAYRITSAGFDDIVDPDDGPAVGYAYSSEAYTVKIEEDLIELSDSGAESKQLLISLTREDVNDVGWTRILLRNLTENGLSTYNKSFISTESYYDTGEDVQTMIPDYMSNDAVYVLFAAVPRAFSIEYSLQVVGPPRLISTKPLQVYP